MYILWIVLLVAAIVIEALTTDFVAIWFFPAALCSLILSFFSVPPLYQVLCFVALGVILVFATRPLCRRFLKGKRAATNVDALIGKTCLVTEEICNIEGRGEVRVGGLCWSARSEDGGVIAVGTEVTVIEIRGVKLIVK